MWEGRPESQEVIMKILIRAAVAASSLALVVVAAPANAMPATYAQSVGSLECDGHVTDDGDGGTMYVRVAGREVRPSDKHFRTYKIVTRLLAQEKTYDGTWKTVEVTRAVDGRLGRARNVGDYNVAKFTWAGNTNPELAVEVAGHDDLFRAKVVTKLIDDEGVKIKQLSSIAGQCRL